MGFHVEFREWEHLLRLGSNGSMASKSPRESDITFIPTADRAYDEVTAQRVEVVRDYAPPGILDPC
jgi:hypothetical protein